MAGVVLRLVICVYREKMHGKKKFHKKFILFNI